MKKNSIFITILGLLLFASVSFAEERVEMIDEDGDGRKETKVFYEGDKIVKAVADKNNDGKPDIFVKFKGGKRHLGERDSNFDGKVDDWSYYDEKGILKKGAKDSNADGKPDQFKELLQGRDLVLRAFDRNFDGKIDQRKLTQWDMIRTVPGQPPIPGYISLWREEDNDFDGIIDVYHERKRKDSQQTPRNRLGQPI